MSVARYRSAATEAGMLATLREAVERAGGCHYRIVDSRKQDMQGWPDLMCFVPYRGSGHDLTLLGLELKTANDRVRLDQELVRGLFNRTVHVRYEIVRAGRMREHEVSIDEALELIANGDWV